LGTTGIYNIGKTGKFFEYTNHLGNVLATISDRKIGHDGGSGTYNYYDAEVKSAQDYYSYGMLQPNRQYNSQSARYGVNGQERSFEINSNGDHYTAQW